MTNPENIFSHQDSGESIGEEGRQTYEARGKKTMDAAERAAKVKRLEEIRKRKQEILEEKARRAEAAAAKQPTTEEPSSEIPVEHSEQPEKQAEQDKTPTVAETTKKAKKNSALRNVLIAATSIALAGAIGFGIFSSTLGKKSESTPTPTPAPVVEAVEDTGEKDELRLQYDYTEWADFEHKSSHNAYGTDYSDCYGDDEKTTAGFLKKAESMPEALASYKSIFFEDEQKELGIWDMTEKELEEFMSDESSPEAAAMQKKLLDAIAVILNDKENTKWEYNLEDNTENSYYVIWEDENSDGVQTPDEMHLGYSVSARHKAPQANLYRRAKDKTGDWVKVLDLNLYCGFQPNTPTDTPPDVPLIPDEEPSGAEGTGSEGTGSEGTGSEGEDTGSEGTGSEGEDTGSEVEGTGEESTGTESEGTGAESEGTGTETVVAPKDEENLTRIDDQIEEDIETDVHTGDIIITPTEDVTEVEEVTDKPTADDYHEPAPVIVKNEAAEEAEPIQGDTETGVPSQISSENDYSEDRGGANEDKGSENPVIADQAAQDAADAAEIPIDEAPGVDDIGGQELDDILAGLGIN